MKINIHNSSLLRAGEWRGLVLILSGLLISSQAVAVGTWTPLNNTAPGSVGLMLLLSDGTVMCAENPDDVFGDFGHSWFLLRPDVHGSYINGTWTRLASAIDNRLFYSSDVLRDGRVLVAGGEYGSGSAKAEVYDPLANTWTAAPVPVSLMDPTQQSPPLFPGIIDGFYDAISKILPNGNVLVAPVGVLYDFETLLYNPTLNTWSAGSNLLNSANQDECSWVKLPDDSILTIDFASQSSERYIPALNQWFNDAVVPVAMFDPGDELGAAFLLPDGRAFFLGGTGHTVFYTPSPLGGTNQGKWAQGPDIPSDGQGNPLVAQDAPAAMMVNGKILCAFGHNENNTTGGGSPSPAFFFEYDPVANSWTPAPAPGNSTPGSTDSCSTYQSNMLDLPDGTVLYCHFEQANAFYQAYGDQLYVYTPDGPPLADGKPTITSITQNPDGSYLLVGTGLNGISEGAAFGDDAQMNSNYPLLRLIDSNGNVTYARTFNWSSTSVMTGSQPVSTEFTAPVIGGQYSLVLVANGFASDPITFYGPLWVDFTANCATPLGTFNCEPIFGGPYPTLADAVTVVATGGTISIKPGSSTETMPLRITKPLTLKAPLGGPATIGLP